MDPQVSTKNAPISPTVESSVSAPPLEVPLTTKNNSTIFFWFSLIILAVFSVAGYFYYQNIQLRKQIISPPVISPPVPIPVFSPVIEDEVLAIQINTCCSCPTKVFSALIGTDGWVVYEKGKNYSRLLPEECDRVDCQPCPPLEEAEQTQIDCKNPRPQVCTMECIQNPPYICGSDGESYCSSCQACSNPEVQWYSLQTTSCAEVVEEKSCGGIAANLPENQCPEGFNCLLDGDYPDAGGKCVKE